MSKNFSWQCPYCNQHTSIGQYNHSENYNGFNMGNKAGELVISTLVIVCPNEECKEYSIQSQLYKRDLRYHSTSNNSIMGEPLKTWNIKPNSLAKSFPDYIPKVILTDYEEACLIRDLSPKASATLSRRCLQGIIRDFWKVKIKSTRLVDEIKAIEDKIDPLTRKTLDAVRNMGNIGAHMEKDINLIIEVDSNEAQLLIQLIERLLKDWYINLHEREEGFSKLIQIEADKEEQKNAQKEPKKQI